MRNFVVFLSPSKHFPAHQTVFFPHRSQFVIRYRSVVWHSGLIIRRLLELSYYGRYWQEWFRWTVQHCLCYSRLTKWLDSWSRFHFEKLIFLQLVRKFSSCYGTRKFITAFTSARHLSLCWATFIQYMPPPPTSLISILILSSHLHLVLPSVLFPSYWPTIHCIRLSSPILATCPAHPILLYLLTWIIFVEEWRSLSSSLCIFLNSPVISPKYSP